MEEAGEKGEHETGGVEAEGGGLGVLSLEGVDEAVAPAWEIEGVFDEQGEWKSGEEGSFESAMPAGPEEREEVAVEYSRVAEAACAEAQDEGRVGCRVQGLGDLRKEASCERDGDGQGWSQGCPKVACQGFGEVFTELMWAGRHEGFNDTCTGTNPPTCPG